MDEHDDFFKDIGEAKIAGLVDLQFIFCSLYILLGMAVIAMCFNLMQGGLF